MRLGNGFNFSRLVGYQMYGMNMNEYKSKWSTQVESGNLENPGYILTVVEPAAQFTDIHRTERKNKQTKQMQP